MSVDSREESDQPTPPNRSALKWRMQYGRRPPKKSDEERQKEQDLIEQFLAKKSSEPQPEAPQQEPERKSARSSQRDQKLVAKFLEKRVKGQLS